MAETIIAALFATFLWWFSTGVIFFFNARPQRTFPWTLAAASLVLAGALYGIWATAAVATTAGAFIAFTCGVLIWGWHTMSYYMGIVTGPRRHGCPSDCRGWRHFVHAVETGLYHELAIIATAVFLAALTWDAPNRYGLWTFLVLWGMHVSAKLNVFLGVRNLNKDFIPQHLGYLTSFFRRRSMNLLFPFSVTIGTLITAALVQAALAPDAGAFDRTGLVLLAALMALAVIEHWFMILPIPADVLWRWSLDPAPVRHRSAPRPTRDGDRQLSSAAPTARVRSKAAANAAARR